MQAETRILEGRHGTDPRSPAGRTLPQVLHEQAARLAGQDFMRVKRHGVWRGQSWQGVLERVRALALAMIAQGVKPGDVVAVISENQPEAYMIEYAAQCAGAAATHLYPDATSDELGFALSHSGAKLLFAEDQEQVDKFLASTEPNAVQRVIYLDDRGLWTYEDARLQRMAVFLEDLPAAPADREALRRELDRCVAQGKDTDLAALCYTSGTTSRPKGVRLSHRYLLDNAYRLMASFELPEHTVYFSYISLAWAAEQITGLALALLTPSVVHFAEKPSTVPHDLREISPQFLLFTPRQWEMMASGIASSMLAATPLRRRLYDWALAQDARSSPVAHWLAELLVLRAVRDNLGMKRASFPVSAGSGLSAEIFRRFHAMGVPLKNLYGSTELGLVSAHWGGDADPATLGRPLLVDPSVGPPLRLQLEPDGELLVGGGAGFGGYFNDPAATGAALSPAGLYRSGDAVHWSEAGDLVFLDRMKDMRRLSTGARFPPQTIENHLRASPFIRDAIVLGDEQRPHVAALINIDSEIVGRYLEARNVGWGTFAELSQLPVVLGVLEQELRRVNRLLPAGSHVLRFANLPKELDADDAELTRSRKLKRDVIEDRYGVLIDMLYSKAADCRLTVQVLYRDGSKASVAAQVFARDVATEAT